jgi:hypothetical protein
MRQVTLYPLFYCRNGKALSLAQKAEVDAIVHQDDGASVRKQQDRGVFVSAAWGTSYPKRSEVVD